jgi:hypothetical protein
MMAYFLAMECRRVAQNRHADAVTARLLLGDKRTWPGRGSKSENEPQTMGGVRLMPIISPHSEIHSRSSGTKLH